MQSLVPDSVNVGPRGLVTFEVVANAPALSKDAVPEVEHSTAPTYQPLVGEIALVNTIEVWEAAGAIK
jgi:hypothetical protein